jgi:rare lipoprotein A
VFGKTYVPLEHADGFVETGLASWYGPGFHGKKTASGETYDMHARTAAHKTLPLGTIVQISNLENGAAATARINDRGPFVRGRVIDLSYALATDLGVVGPGTARVRVEALQGPDGAAPPRQVLEGPFAWQVGAFTVAANANGLSQKLRPSFDSVTVEQYDRGDALFHRVRVGWYPRQADAQVDLAPLRGQGLDPFLVRRD